MLRLIGCTPHSRCAGSKARRALPPTPARDSVHGVRSSSRATTEEFRRLVSRYALIPDKYLRHLGPSPCTLTFGFSLHPRIPSCCTSRFVREGQRAFGGVTARVPFGVSSLSRVSLVLDPSQYVVRIWCTGQACVHRGPQRRLPAYVPQDGFVSS